MEAWTPEDGPAVVYLEGSHGVVAELSPDEAEALGRELLERATFARERKGD